MSPLDAALLALIQGAAEALPVSRSGHVVVARLWLDAGPPHLALEGALHAATAAGIAIAARARILGAIGDGVRAVSRPALFRTSPGARDALVLLVAASLSLLVSALVRPHVEMFSTAPIAVGLGLMATGLALVSAALSPAGKLDTPPLVGAAAAGIAHGLALFPGASPVAAALAVLLWLGIRAPRALEIALVMTIPSLLSAFLEARAAGPPATISPALMGTASFLAFGAAWAAAAAMREFLRRRSVATLALWVVPLALATLAFARALPRSGA